MEVPKDSSEIEEEEKKSRNWADQVEEEESKVKKEATTKEDFLKRIEELKRKVVTTREWQELKPRTVRAVKAFGDGQEEKLSRQLELSFEPGALITGVWPASWLMGAWLEGTLEGRVGLVPEGWVEYLPALSDSD